MNGRTAKLLNRVAGIRTKEMFDNNPDLKKKRVPFGVVRNATRNALFSTWRNLNAKDRAKARREFADEVAAVAGNA